MRPYSLLGRLGAFLALGFVILWIAAAVASSVLIRREVDMVFDASLQETAERLLPLVAMDLVERQAGSEIERIAALHEHEGMLAYVVRGLDGAILLQSHDARPEFFPPNLSSGFATTATHRVFAETAVKGTLTLLVAMPLEQRRRTFEATSRALMLPVGLLLPAGVFGAIWLVRTAGRSLGRFCLEVEGRGSGDLRPLDTRTLPSELAPLAVSVNQLMERLQRALDAERAFGASSAHELRTPMARALAEVQRLEAETRSLPMAGRVRRIEGSLRDLARLTEKLMELARAEGGRLAADGPVDIVPYLVAVVEEFRRRPDVGERLVLDVPEGEVGSRVDGEAFALLARNLVENAVRHGTVGGRVEVSLSAGGVLRVANDGDPVPPGILADLGRPFARGATASSGSGLGLAIASAVARGSGSRLELLSPAPGSRRGFVASVALPTVGPASRPPA